MIETEITLMIFLFVVLYILLLIVNYKGFTKYLNRLTEGALGKDTLERKSLGRFIIIKTIIFLVILFISIALTVFISPIIPARYLYLYWGIVLGFVTCNLIYDLSNYRRAAKRGAKTVA